jgi:hypothetical protein
MVDDTLHKHAESTAKTYNVISLEDLGNAVTQTSELTLVCNFANISGKPCSGEVKGARKGGGCCSSSTIRSPVTPKVAPELSFCRHRPRNLLVCVLENKVEGLCGEVSDDGTITTPIPEESLL